MILGIFVLLVLLLVVAGVWGDLAVRQARRDLDAWDRELERRSRDGFIYDDDDNK